MLIAETGPRRDRRVRVTWLPPGTHRTSVIAQYFSPTGQIKVDLDYAARLRTPTPGGGPVLGGLNNAAPPSYHVSLTRDPVPEIHARRDSIAANLAASRRVIHPGQAAVKDGDAARPAMDQALVSSPEQIHSTRLEAITAMSFLGPKDAVARVTVDQVEKKDDGRLAPGA